MNQQSIKQLMITLPEAVEEIVHRYHHQIQMKSVMDELKSRVVHCDRCECDKVYHRNINIHTCNYDNCHNTVCDHCYNNYMRYSTTIADFDEEITYPLCEECIILDEEYDQYESDEESMNSSEFAEMLEEAEEEHWQNSYGCNGDANMMY